MVFRDRSRARRGGNSGTAFDREGPIYGPLPRSVGEAKFLLLLTERLVEIGATAASLRGGNDVFVCDLATLSCQ
jgi:hypothetical protein